MQRYQRQRNKGLNSFRNKFRVSDIKFPIFFTWACCDGPQIRPQAGLAVMWARPKPMAQPHIPFLSVFFCFKPVENSKNHRKTTKTSN